MSTAATTDDRPKIDYTKTDASGLFGHPKGLMTLFFTEMWERFSYYGMRAILLLYMVTPAVNGGMGLPKPTAALIYGLYTSSVYLMSIPGGFMADNVLGSRLAVLIGGIIIACGHYSMVVPSDITFFAGLVLIVFGTGLLKPNISGIVGSLYAEGDPRRDGGFSIFYMGINLGAFIAPLVCGYLAQSDQFKNFLKASGFNPLGSWHWGFGAAGIGMTFGLLQYLLFQKNLRRVGNRPEISTGEMVTRTSKVGAAIVAAGVIGVAVGFVIKQLWPMITGGKHIETTDLVGVTVGFITLVGIIIGGAAFLRALKGEERNRFVVIIILFAAAALFWAAFEQAGSSLTLFADKLTRNSIFGWTFPSAWFQSVNSIFIILLAPLFSVLWVGLGTRQPSSPAKFSLGLLAAGLGFIVVAFASTLVTGNASNLTAADKVSPVWLVSVYFIHTVGELCLSPVGLSTFTKLAPARLVGLMLGIWFLAASVGNFVAGLVAGNFDETAEGAVFKLFAGVAVVTIIGSGILLALTPYARKLIGKAE